VETWPEAGIKFDVITCLNLLDRCDKPLSLLRELKASLSPGGRVVVALVLPFNPYVETGKLPKHKNCNTKSRVFVPYPLNILHFEAEYYILQIHTYMF